MGRLEAGPLAARRGDWDVLVAAACGGVLGAEGRYGLSRAVTHRGPQFPWSTVLVNVSGCFLIGALMVSLLELFSAPSRLARPFLGVGVLGGYTTFSTFEVDAQRLLMAHRPGVAVCYLASTVLLGAIAVQLGTWVTRSLGGRFERASARPSATEAAG